MTLAVGARLGPYEIVSALGAGGMGEVYRAKDPRLGREVAIKVLPASFAADTERLCRRHRIEGPERQKLGAHGRRERVHRVQGQTEAMTLGAVILVVWALTPYQSRDAGAPAV